MEEFIRDHGETCLKLFDCPAGVDPLYFSTLCVYFYAECQKVIDQAKEKVKRDISINSTGVGDGQQGSHPSENTNESTQPNQSKQSNQPKPNTTSHSKKKPKSKSQYLGGYAGKVMVGSRYQPICIPAGSCKFLVGTAKGVPHKGNFMMEGTQDGNLPSGVTVNNTYVQPNKSGHITVCLQNTNDHNVWIRQPLYAGDLWDVDKEDWEYEPVLVKDISPNPEKVDKVRDWPIPKTSKEVHSFIGLASYYRRFIPNFAKWSKPLNVLIVPPAHQVKVRCSEMKKSELTEFVWSKECQEGFDALKHALTTAPVLAYTDYTQPFILETDTSLKGLGAVLSQKGKDGEVHVIAYASRSLRPSERSMRDYSSAKIKLMALKWSVCEKFKDYLLGSKFTVFTDNNPLVYVKTSKLGAAQIRWLSKLALYDFDIVYHTGRSNLFADALSHRPEAEGENHNQACSDNDDEEWQAISYSAICEELQGIISGVKVKHSLREHIQVVQSAEDDIHGSCKIEVVAGMVDVFYQVPSTTMAEHQAKDNQLAPVLEWVHEGKSPTKAVIYQVRSKNTLQLMYQFHRLILKNGVLHRLYIHNDVEYHQLVLPQRYHKKVLQSLHNDLGHQGVNRTLDLLRERVYWPTMTQDASSWVEQCRRCQVAKGDYNIPKPKYGHLIAHNPLDLVCLDFTKVHPSKGGKENVLVMTDAFTKFSVAVTTNNQQALTVAKALVERWFHVYGIPSCIHSDQGKSFDNRIIDALCKMYGVERTMTSPYNP